MGSLTAQLQIVTSSVSGDRRLILARVNSAQVTRDNQTLAASIKPPMRDLRYGFRLIRRQPMFGTLVIAMLTLGIGATTSMFSVIYGVLLKRLPYGEPDRLVWMYGSFRGGDTAAVSPPD